MADTKKPDPAKAESEPKPKPKAVPEGAAKTPTSPPAPDRTERGIRMVKKSDGAVEVETKGPPPTPKQLDGLVRVMAMASDPKAQATGSASTPASGKEEEMNKGVAIALVVLAVVAGIVLGNVFLSGYHGASNRDAVSPKIDSGLPDGQAFCDEMFPGEGRKFIEWFDRGGVPTARCRRYN